MSDAPDDYTLAENRQTVLSNTLKQPDWCTASDFLVSATRPTPTLADALAVPEVAKLVEALRDTTDALGKFVDTSRKTREPYETPLSAYDRARAALDQIKGA
jgi:hypothetical protein